MNIEHICSSMVRDVRALFSDQQEPKNIRDVRIAAVALRAIAVVVGTYSAVSILGAIVTAASAPISATISLIFASLFFVLCHDAFIVGNNLSSEINCLTAPTLKDFSHIGRGFLNEIVNGVPTVFTDTWVAGSIYKNMHSR